MRENGKRIIKCIVFCILFVGLVSQLNRLFVPRWEQWSNCNTMYGFYEEPKNTFDTVFFGTSTTLNGISPMELYEDYGICAYNFGTEQQAAYASLAWLDEAYRRHNKTLKNVILDVSCLRKSVNDSMFRKAMDPLHFSKMKFDIVMKHAGSLSASLKYLLPVYAYHSRWDSLAEMDYRKYYVKPAAYLRGYNYDGSQEYFLGKGYSAIGIPAYKADDVEGTAKLDDTSVEGFLAIVDYCREKNLNLILMKVPSGDYYWKKTEHNAVVQMLEENGLTDEVPFLDMNYQPIQGEVGYDHVLDTIDNNHMNYQGAKKITAYIGKYMCDHGMVVDNRDNPKYAYMKDELAAYKSFVLRSDLNLITDPVEYLRTVKDAEGNYTILIGASKDAATALREDQRQAFEELGLSLLSQLEASKPYVGVICDHEVLLEDSVSRKEDKRETVICEQVLKNGSRIYAMSGKNAQGKNVADFMIDGTEYVKAGVGLSVVVYDSKHDILVDTAVFNTSEQSERDDIDYRAELNRNIAQGIPYEEYSEYAKRLYQYRIKTNDRYVREKVGLEIGPSDLLSYLQIFRSMDQYVLYLSVKDDAATALDEEARAALAEAGLTELSQLQVRESYIAVVNGAKVLYEDRGNQDTPCSMTLGSCELNSAGYSSGDVSSCKIDGKEHSPNERGINIVVYNQFTKEVIDARAFDTNKEVQTLADPADAGFNAFGEAAQGTWEIAEDMEDYADELLAEYIDNDKKIHQYRVESADLYVRDRSRNTIGEKNLLEYLKMFADKNEYILYLSVRDEASRRLNEAARTKFAEMGLAELAKIQTRESYVAVLCGKEVLYEERGTKKKACSVTLDPCTLYSAGYSAGNVSSCMIGGEEYSLNERGINIVVYNQETGEVSESRNFDTWAVTPVVLQ